MLLVTKATRGDRLKVTELAKTLNGRNLNIYNYFFKVFSFCKQVISAYFHPGDNVARDGGGGEEGCN